MPAKYKPLSGLNVLITRPAGQEAPLAAQLRKLGAGVEVCPALIIAPPRHPKAAEAALQDLTSYDLFIFTSAQAVSPMKRWWPSTPLKGQLIAIGPGTNKALQAAGFPSALIPEGHFNSEGVLALPICESAAGKKILICSGEGGNPFLQETLQKRGAEVIKVELYRRTRPSPLSPTSLKQWQQKPIHLIVATSTESLHNLQQLFEPIRTWYCQRTFLIISDTMREEAKKQGIAHIIQATNATQAAIVDTLLEWYGALSQHQKEKPVSHATSSFKKTLIFFLVLGVSGYLFWSTLKTWITQWLPNQEVPVSIQFPAASERNSGPKEIEHLLYYAQRKLVVDQDPAAARDTLLMLQVFTYRFHPVPEGWPEALEKAISHLNENLTQEQQAFETITQLQKALTGKTTVEGFGIADSAETDDLLKKKGFLKQPLISIRQTPPTASGLTRAQQALLLERLLINGDLAKWALTHHNQTMWDSSLSHLYQLTSQLDELDPSIRLNALDAIQRLQALPFIRTDVDFAPLFQLAPFFNSNSSSEADL